MRSERWFDLMILSLSSQPAMVMLQGSGDSVLQQGGLSTTALLPAPARASLSYSWQLVGPQFSLIVLSCKGALEFVQINQSRYKE